jgi:TorA maturation chaperone TorD
MNPEDNNPAPFVAMAMLADAISEDFGLLAALHDREPTAEALTALRATPAKDWLGVRIEPAVTEALDAALAEQPDPIDETALDGLAADYADIYLVSTYEAAPVESYWLDDENLVCQDAMFDVRGWQALYGLEAENWRQRSDDHLVLQLLFLSHLTGHKTEIALRDAARFLDRHLLLWIGDFAARVQQRAREPWFRALAVTTAVHAQTTRELLETVLDEPRWHPPEPEKPKAPDLCQLKDALKFIPGTGPGW